MDQVLMSGDALGWLLALASNPVLLGLFVFGLVATVKRSRERQCQQAAAAGRSLKPGQPRTWQGLAFGVGLLSSLLLHWLTGRATFGGGWLGAVLFGLVAGLISIVGRDGLKTVLSWFGLAATSVVVAPTPAPGAGVALPQSTPTGAVPPGPPEPERPATPEDLVRMTGTGWPDVPLERELPEFLKDLDVRGGSRAERL